MIKTLIKFNAWAEKHPAVIGIIVHTSIVLGGILFFVSLKKGC